MYKPIETKLPVILFLSFLLFLFFSDAAMAQTPPPPPSGDEAGAAAGRFKDESEFKKGLDKKKPKAPEIEIEKEKKEKPVVGGPSFTLKDVKVTGSTIFKDEDFRPAYEKYLDKSISYAEVDSITNDIEKKYKEKGYLTTSVYLPEQDVVGGKIEVRILEGKMGDVKVEGNKWFSADLIKKYFHSKKNEILNIFKLSRDLMRLNQNPDLEIKSVLTPGKETGYSDVTLKVKEKFPYHAGSSYDNQGTRLTGKPRTAISGRATNLSGNNDSLFFNTIISAMSQGNFASYLLPIDTFGTKIGMDFVVFTNKLGREYKGYGITGNTQSYTPHIASEMYLSDDLQINTDAGFEIKSVKKWIMGEKSSNDQLRMPFVGMDITKIDSFSGGGQTSLSSKFIFNTSSFMGSSRHDHVAASRSGTGGFFFKYEQTLSRLQRMPADSYILAKCVFQNATHSLPSSEQMQFGGAYYTRGYPEGDYLADYGINLNAEWVFPMPFVPKDFKLPYSETPLCHQFEPVVFMDLGAGKIKKPSPSERETKILMGLGGGLKVRINTNIFLRLEWAERVGDRPTQGQAPSNFYISFQFES